MKTRLLKIATAILITTSFVVICGCQNQTGKVELDKFKYIAQIQNQNKEIVREFFSAIDGNKFDRLNELFSNDFSLKSPGVDTPWKKRMFFKPSSLIMPHSLMDS